MPPELVAPAEDVSPPEPNPPPAPVGLEPPAPSPASPFDEPHPMSATKTKSAQRNGIRSRSVAKRHNSELGGATCDAMIFLPSIELDRRAADCAATKEPARGLDRLTLLSEPTSSC
jgi:hypothetical protein